MQCLSFSLNTNLNEMQSFLLYAFKQRFPKRHKGVESHFPLHLMGFGTLNPLGNFENPSFNVSLSQINRFWIINLLVLCIFIYELLKISKLYTFFPLGKKKRRNGKKKTHIRSFLLTLLYRQMTISVLGHTQVFLMQTKVSSILNTYKGLQYTFCYKSQCNAPFSDLWSLSVIRLILHSCMYS